MALYTLRDISLSYGGPAVLDAVSLTINEGERACITGRNGAGKSSLLKILARQIEPDGGEVLPAPGLRVAYLSQEVPEDRPGSAEEVAEEEVLESSSRSRVQEFLTRFGIEPDAVFSELSGGMRRRVLLAAALASEPGLLLLDEPTNHLDIESIEALERHLLRAQTMACVFITHDRAFLKRTATRVFDLDRGRLAGWNCNYETFLQRRATLEEEEKTAVRRLEKRLKQEESWLIHGVTARRSRNIGRLAGLKALRQEIADRRQKVGSSKMEFGQIAASGELVVKAENVTFRYPNTDEPIIRDFSATILRRERIGILGPNGYGKTTLLRLLLGKLTPQEGEITLGSRTEVSFLDQLRGTLQPDKTVGENVADGQELVDVNGTRRHLNGYLQDFLFTPDRIRTPVRALSGGERARLLLAKLFLSPGNVLVMDEPTNDLDIETLELLEEQLLSYKGTLLLVSHDREFLDHVVTSSFVLTGEGHVHICPGGYETWAAEKAVLQSKKQQEAAAAATQAVPTQTKLSQKRLGFNEKRELTRLPDEIAALEKEIAELEAILEDGSQFISNPEKAQAAAARHPLAQAELDQKLERWMLLSEQAE